MGQTLTTNKELYQIPLDHHVIATYVFGQPGSSFVYQHLTLSVLVSPDNTVTENFYPSDTILGNTFRIPVDTIASPGTYYLNLIYAPHDNENPTEDFGFLTLTSSDFEVSVLDPVDSGMLGTILIIPCIFIVLYLMYFFFL
jgi:hypothetical protein